MENSTHPKNPNRNELLGIEYFDANHFDIVKAKLRSMRIKVLKWKT